jgi:ATP-binding cassette subfamily F protein 3
VQSRIKALERVERIEVPQVRTTRLRLSLPEPPRSGREVVRLSGVAKSYGATRVFADTDLVVERGQTVAVLGANGAGKSTLLRLVAGIEQPDAGERRLGHHVRPAYFAQHHTDALDLDRTVLAELEAALADRSTNPRSILGAFGFPGDTVDKRVAMCSGGERARLALARLVVGPANLLCLDEPTNHLDIASRELLTDALVAYGGTVLLVTHDRELIRTTADAICAVGEGQAHLFDGELDDYLAWRERRAEVSDGSGAAAGHVEGSPVTDRRQQRRNAADQRRRTQHLRTAVTQAEADLERAEQRLAKIEGALADPDTYEDPEAARELTVEHAVVADRLAEAERRWEALVDELEAATADA